MLILSFYFYFQFMVVNPDTFYTMKHKYNECSFFNESMGQILKTKVDHFYNLSISLTKFFIVIMDILL